MCNQSSFNKNIKIYLGSRNSESAINEDFRTSTVERLRDTMVIDKF